MLKKIVIRKKAFINREKKYFEISDNFFKPLTRLLKKKKKIDQFIFLFTTPQIMRLMF
jgi:hypothetical protein